MQSGVGNAVQAGISFGPGIMGSAIPTFAGGGIRPSRPGRTVPPPPDLSRGVPAEQCAPDDIVSVSDASSHSICCNRFTLVNDILVDGLTGSLWRLTKDNVLEEVPRRPTKAEEKDIKDRIDEIKKKYEQEVLKGISAKNRKALLKNFDQRYLAAFRTVVGDK